MTKYEMQLVIGALRHKAHDEAACSQGPDLINKRDAQEWELADKLEARVAHMDRKGWTTIDERAAAAGFIVGSHGIGIPRQHLTDGPVDAVWLKDALIAFADSLIQESTNHIDPEKDRLATEIAKRKGFIKVEPDIAKLAERLEAISSKADHDGHEQTDACPSAFI